ncbi:MAG: 16S rRNA (cytidine(1402)-2'-O)-methyltransferase, partial [Betaproteobacteria bacterium]
QVRRLAVDPRTQVLFEAPHRIAALAGALAEACPARPVTACRELTKQFETVVKLPAAELPAWLAADAHRLRGEFVLVLHALPAHAVAPAHDDTADRLLAALLRELPLKTAVALAAEASGAPRNALYRRALALRGAAADREAAPGDASRADS